MTFPRSSLLRDQRGNSLVELALVAPVFASLIVGAVDLSRAYSDKLSLEQAAQRAVERIQIGEFKTTDKSTYEAEATTAAGTGATATLTAWLECNNDGSKLDYDDGVCANATDPYARYVQIKVTRDFKPLFTSKIFSSAASNGSVPLTVIAGVRTQ